MKARVVNLKERRNKKIQKVKNYKRRRLLFIAGSLIAFFTVVWLIYSSNFFGVAEIRVQGNGHITDQKIIESSGIKQSDSLITLPITKIAKRLERLNWIEKAVAVRDWPDVVILKITERKAIGYMETDRGSFLIDKSAFVIDKKSIFSFGNYIVKIDGLPEEKIEIGRYIKNKALTNALAAYQSFEQDIKKNVYSITANSVDELYFIVGGIEIIYGEASKTDLKNKVIKTILKEKKKNISTIDVRIPDKPVVRLIGR